MKKLILTFGITGCGKSTWLKDKSPVIETDEIRKELLGSVNENDKEADIFQESKRQIIKLFKTCDTIYFGSTMVETKHRLPFLKEIQNECPYDIEFDIIVFKSDPEISKQRIQKDLDDGVDRANSLDIVDEQFKFYEEAILILDDEKIYSKIEYVGFKKLDL